MIKFNLQQNEKGAFVEWIVCMEIPYSRLPIYFNLLRVGAARLYFLWFVMISCDTKNESVFMFSCIGFILFVVVVLP